MYHRDESISEWRTMETLYICSSSGMGLEAVHNSLFFLCSAETL